MSDLAYDADGDRFEVPEHVAGWRVRRFRNVGARGAPEVVFGDDGRPLVIAVDATIDEFRAAVGGVPGRYRLDPVDANGRGIDRVPVAYLQFGDGSRPSPGGNTAIVPQHADSMLAEVVRANAEMVKVIADRFGGVMEAAATLLKAADGAGLPARAPLEMPRNGSTGDDDLGDDEEEDEEEAEGGVGDFLSQVMPLVQMVLARRAAPPAPQVRNTASTEPSPPPAKPPRRVAGPVTPEMLMHFQTIQAELTQEEADFARAVAAELSPTEIQEWMAELSSMSVDDAVAMIRKHIAGRGGAS